jgi:membrane protease YdiL (CAAX protease family)
MIGILVQLGISWVLLHFIQKTNLKVLGFKPINFRIVQLLSGVLFGGLLCLIHSLSKDYLTGMQWRWNDDYTIMMFIGGLWWCLKSVLFEELIFRGALCYIGFQRVGPKITMLFSSVCFGIYHWFSWGVLGNPKMMIITFMITGLYGWTLAYSYYKTKSILLGTGLHFGWNAIGLVVFSSGTIGNQLLISNKPEGYAELSGNAQTTFFFVQLLGIPLAHFLLVSVVLRFKSSQNS